MSDPVSKTVADFKNPDLYETRKNVPVFTTENVFKTVRDGEGKVQWVKVEVKDADLAKICQNTNDDCKLGNNPIGTIGHLDYRKDVPEISQPPLCCYWDEFHVGEFGPQKKKAILATQYIRKQYTEEVKEYPRRSADYNIDEMKISGVALLKRQAQLPLGVIAHDQKERIVSYADEGNTPMDQPANPADAAVPNNPAHPPSATDMDPAQNARMEQCVAGFMQKNYPHLPQIHANHVKSMMPAPPAPKPPPTMPPAAPAAAPPMNPSPPKPPESPMPHDATITPAQFAKLEADLEAQKKAAETDRKAREAIEKELLGERRKSQLAQYAESKVLDLDTEWKDVMDADGAGTPMTVAQYEKHLGRIKANYADKEIDPASLPNIGVSKNGVHHPANGEATPQEEKKIAQFAREEEIAGRHCDLTSDEAYSKVLRKVRGIEEPK